MLHYIWIVIICDIILGVIFHLLVDEINLGFKNGNMTY